MPEALTDGFRLAYLIGAGLAALAAAVTLKLLPKPTAAPQPVLSRLRVPATVLAVVACFVATDLAAAGAPGAPIGTYTTKGTYSFVSAPGLRPPKIRADAPTTASELAPGYILVANFYDVTSPPMVGQGGPLILDNSLQPVWFKPVPTNLVAAEPQPADL